MKQSFGRFIVPTRPTKGGLLRNEKSNKPEVNFSLQENLLQAFLLMMLNILFMMPLPYCVYILFSEKDSLLYTGYTSNIERRLKEHNAGKTKSTSWRRPLQLVFCEFYLFEADARKREMYLKTSPGKKAVKLMLGNTLRQFGYQSLAGMRIEGDGEE